MGAINNTTNFNAVGQLIKDLFENGDSFILRERLDRSAAKQALVQLKGGR